MKNKKLSEGFYPFTSGPNAGLSIVWFSYNVLTHSTTYVVSNCPADAKRQIVECAKGSHPNFLHRPCTIDVFIANVCAREKAKGYVESRKKLSQYEESAGTSQDPSSMSTGLGIEDLHSLSQTWHIIFEDLADSEERLEFLTKVRGMYTAACGQAHRCGEGPRLIDDNSVDESLAFLMSRNRVWKRWAVNYNERTKIRINLFFNLAFSHDNQTNLEIADFTSNIAMETNRDSSSMITIAAMTMFFLPGTLVSAIFSMVFFQTGTDVNGAKTFTVSPRVWYFIAITIPLTILVFVIWVVWRRMREAKRIAYDRGRRSSSGQYCNA